MSIFTLVLLENNPIHMNKKKNRSHTLEEAISQLYAHYNLKDIRIFLNEKKLGLITNTRHWPIASFIENVLEAAWYDLDRKNTA